MDRDTGRKAGLHFLLADKCWPRRRSDLWLALQSERILAPGAAELWREVGLERTAHDVIRSRLARNFSGSANRARRSRRTRGRIEHSRARVEISSCARSANAQSGGPQLLQTTCSNLSRSQGAAR